MYKVNTWKNLDLVLLLTVILIFIIGLAFLYSATYQHSYKSAPGILNNFLLRQIILFIFSLFICIVIVKVDYKVWLELAYPLYGLSVVLLLLVLIIGEPRLGAQRWLGLGNMTFQPSELTKLVVILTLARYLGQRETALSRGLSRPMAFTQVKALLVSLLIVSIPFILIVKQPDLGSALTLVPILFAILYIWGVPLRAFLFVSAVCLFSSPVLWQMLKEYQKKRILVFINPNIDPLGAGYTIIQSKIAIGSGRIWGKGWLSGTQNQLNFLPERHTDFIFSVVGEEWGFFGSILLLLLYFILIWRAFSIVQRTSNLPGRILACGIIFMFSFQVLINISMTMGLVPVVGLPLPLISYGGSSLLTTMASLALLLNIGMRNY